MVKLKVKEMLANDYLLDHLMVQCQSCGKQCLLLKLQAKLIFEVPLILKDP